MSSKVKAKRKLSEIDFTSEGGHIALCSKEQGVANNAPYALVLKATNNFSDEIVQKVQQVRVTMELPEFLRKFFSMYYEDAEILARIMGYDPEEKSDTPYDYEEYLNERVQSIELMKSLHETSDISSFISKMNPEDYLSVIKDQEILEDVLKKAQETSTEVNSGVGADTSEEAVAKSENSAFKFVLHERESTGGWKPTENKSILQKGVKIQNKVNSEEKMTTKGTKSQVAQVEVEVVEKSVLEAIEKEAKENQEKLQKALEDQKAELQKALELVQKFEQEKKEAINKSRFAALKDAVKDEAKAEVLFKAVNLLQDSAEFEAVVKTLKDMNDLVEKSELFVEKGVSAEGEGAIADPVKAVIKRVQSKNK